MDRSEVRYRDILQTLRDLSARPVVPHQYAIGRGEDLVGYVDLVSEEAHAFRRGQPSDVIPVPAEYREREQTARREMLETLADFDDDLMTLLLEDQEPPTGPDHARPAQEPGADQVVPVFMGVAEQDMGVRRLIEALAQEVPEPAGPIGAAGPSQRRADRRPGAEEFLSAACRQALSGPRLAWCRQGRHDAGRHACRRCLSSVRRAAAEYRLRRSRRDRGARPPGRRAHRSVAVQRPAARHAAAPGDPTDVCLRRHRGQPQ